VKIPTVDVFSQCNNIYVTKMLDSTLLYMHTHLVAMFKLFEQKEKVIRK